MESFQAGDVVCLRSGGPDMTIEAVETNSSGYVASLVCVWFVEKTLYRTTFPASALIGAMWPIAA
jgi:uncharacterized protein YodC (DUF2158 family)